MWPRIEGLATDPRPPGCKKLRTGDRQWRIVYEINDKTRAVDVTRIAHRREVYD
jgi:mRNA interferase RelE/StbE